VGCHVHKTATKDTLKKAYDNKLFQIEDLNKNVGQSKKPFSDELCYVEKIKTKIEFLKNEIEKRADLKKCARCNEKGRVSAVEKVIDMIDMKKQEQFTFEESSEDEEMENIEKIKISEKVKSFGNPAKFGGDPKAVSDSRAASISLAGKKTCYCLLNEGELHQKVEEEYKSYMELKQLVTTSKENIKILKEDLYILQEVEEFNGARQTERLQLEKSSEFNYVSGIVPTPKLVVLKRTLGVLTRGNMLLHLRELIDSEGNSNHIFIVFTIGDHDRISKLVSSIGARPLRMERYSKIADAKIEGNLERRSSKYASVLLSQLNRMCKIASDDFNDLAKRISAEILSLSSAADRLVSVYGNMGKMLVYDRIAYFEAWMMKSDVSKLDFMSDIDNFDILSSSMSDSVISNSPMSIISNSISNSISNLKTNTNNTNSNITIANTNKEKLKKFIYDEIPTRNKIPTRIYVNKYTEAFQWMSDAFGVSTSSEINPAIFTLFTFPFLFGAMFGDIGHGLLMMAASLLVIKYKTVLDAFDFLDIIICARYILFLNGLYAVFWGFLYSEFLGTPFNSPVGIYYKWHWNEEFVNSLRMKLSMIIGYAHMLMGLVINIANLLIQKDYLMLFTEAAPKFVAFNCFLGYMVFLIYFKYVAAWEYSIISIMVKMFTSPFVVDGVYPGQKAVQLSILALFAASLPWMCFSKYFAKKFIDCDTEEEEEGLIESLIGTVEFGVGLISNSSSYLRIWAVSLAHSQLTIILSNLTIKDPNKIKAVILLPVYISGTFAILLCLEGLSSCLHAMRLNWIEFYNKFFHCKGVLYKPIGSEDE